MKEDRPDESWAIRSQQVAEQWQIELAKHDAIVVPLLIPLALSPVMAGYATIAAVDVGPPWGAPWLGLFPAFGPISSLLAVATFVVGLAMFSSARLLKVGRRRRKRWLTLCVGALMSLGYQMWPAQFTESQTEAWEHVQTDSRPVIDALADFKSLYGRYPDRLDELVPRYFSSLPSPGFVGYPEYGYAREREEYVLFVPIQSWPHFDGNLSYRSVPPAVLKPDFWKYGKWRFDSSVDPRTILK